MSVAEAVALAHGGDSFLVTCHRRPDADALGSALGFAAILESLGKEVLVYNPDELSMTLRFLPGVDRVVREVPEGRRFDATWLMDTASPALLPSGLPGRSQRGPMVVVDHHAAYDVFGDLTVRDAGACATGEVVLNLMEALGVESIPPLAATPIYAAIVADTGGFRYASTSARTLRLGARLIDAGAEPWEVAYHLFEGWEPERMRLLGAILDTLETFEDGKLSVLKVTREMLDRLGANDDMVEGMVNYGRMLSGVEVAVLLWEWPVLEADGTRRLDTKVSLRSRGPIDVSRIAVPLGGGGHAAAAGVQLHAELEEAAGRVLSEVEKLLR